MCPHPSSRGSIAASIPGRTFTVPRPAPVSVRLDLSGGSVSESNFSVPFDSWYRYHLSSRLVESNCNTPGRAANDDSPHDPLDLDRVFTECVARRGEPRDCVMRSGPNRPIQYHLRHFTIRRPGAPHVLAVPLDRARGSSIMTRLGTTTGSYCRVPFAARKGAASSSAAAR
jgi:hypothetical protein